MCGWDVGEWGNERQCKQDEWNIPAVPQLLKAQDKHTAKVQTLVSHNRYTSTMSIPLRF